MYATLKFIGRHTIEALAAATSIIVFAGGCYLAWVVSPPWLNRAGAIITIVGILLAVSRFHRWAQEKAVTLFESNVDSITRKALASGWNESKPFSEKDREAIQHHVIAEFRNELAEMVESDKSRIRALEVVIVIGGTFLLEEHS